MSKYVISNNTVSGYEKTRKGHQYLHWFRLVTSTQAVWDKASLLKEIEQVLIDCNARTKSPAKYARWTFDQFIKEQVIFEVK